MVKLIKNYIFIVHYWNAQCIRENILATTYANSALKLAYDSKCDIEIWIDNVQSKPWLLSSAFIMGYYPIPTGFFDFVDNVNIKTSILSFLSLAHTLYKKEQISKWTSIEVSKPKYAEQAKRLKELHNQIN